MIQALLLDATARDALGDGTPPGERSSTRSSCRGGRVLLPFLLFPAPELLERHGRSRTAHAALLADVRAARRAHAGSARGGRRPVGGAAQRGGLRVLRHLPTNLRAPEIAAELFVSVNTGGRTCATSTRSSAHQRAEAVERRELGLLRAVLGHALSPGASAHAMLDATAVGLMESTRHPRDEREGAMVVAKGVGRDSAGRRRPERLGEQRLAGHAAVSHSGAIGPAFARGRWPGRLTPRGTWQSTSSSTSRTPPGALAQVAAAISDAGVNLAAATCIGGGERAELHILVPHAEAAAMPWRSPMSR